MSDRFPIQALLEKYFEGTCTPEEMESLMTWYHGLNAEHPGSYPTAEELMQWKEAGWNRIVGSRRRTARMPWLLAAASLLAILTGWTVYTALHRNVNVIAATAAGERRRIVLPDHSVVWLNASTRITYAKNMDKRRIVMLEEGEAFFDVVKDDRHPFEVKTPGGINVRVLGTSFTVDAGGSTQEARVTVIAGKVLVEKNGAGVGVLAKGQGAVFTGRQQTVRLIHVDPAQVSGWANGRVTLEDVPFGQLTAALQNTFGYRVFADTTLRDFHSSISFSSADSLEDILEVLHTIYRVTYRVDTAGKIIYLQKKE